MIKQMILDRDGTLIRHIPYLSDPQQVVLLPGVREGLNRLRNAGCSLFLHTNQSGVARGYFSMQDVHACNDEMLRQIGMGNNLFEAICISPEGAHAIDGYRKPSPKFGLELIDTGRADIASMCYLGDNVSDLLAARNIGCLGVGVDTGEHDLRGMLRDAGLIGKFAVFDTFADAVEHIVNYNRFPNETD